VRTITTRIRQVLLAQAGGRCMAPECKVGTGKDDAAAQLEMARIYALSPGGLRYDDRLGDAEVSAPENFLILCANHHRLVDARPETYPGPQLTEWREHAIARTAARLIAAPTRQDAATVLDDALATWEHHRDNGDEEFWQEFFTSRPSLLLALAQSVGVGLRTKCYVGGKDIANQGGGIVDFIVKERGNATLIEIKSPTAPLLGPKYRQNVWPPSHDLAGACSQALHYRSNLLHEFYVLARDEPEFEAPDPHCVVLLGDVGRLNLSMPEMRSLALFRQAMPTVTVLAYDELFERLRRTGALLRAGDAL
jgi:Domain of unknown function (DUF4263)